MKKLHQSEAYGIISGAEVLVIRRSVGFSLIFLADNTMKYVINPTDITKDADKLTVINSLVPLAETVKVAA